jgi:hypothetical protein
LSTAAALLSFTARRKDSSENRSKSDAASRNERRFGLARPQMKSRMHAPDFYLQNPFISPPQFHYVPLQCDLQKRRRTSTETLSVLVNLTPVNFRN